MTFPHPVLIELAAGRAVPARVDDPEFLLTTALDHRMQGLLWSAVRREEIDLPLETERLLALSDLRSRAHHLRLWAALEEVTTLLGQHDIEVVTFKGVAAEAQWYERIGERPSRDLDLWLSPHQADRVDEVVNLVQPDHPLAGRLSKLFGKGLLQSIDIQWGGQWIDLHTDPFKLGVPVLSLKAVWEQRIGLGSSVSTLDPGASLAQFLIHLNKDRFSWLLGFADIVRILDADPEAATHAAEIARQDGLSVPVSRSMALVSSVLGRPSPLPPASGWGAQAWDRLWPPKFMLGGDEGYLYAHRRQVLLPLFGPNRTGQAIRNIARIALPPSDLLEIYFPDVSGPYPVRLIRGRTRRLIERRRRFHRFAEDQPDLGHH